MGFSKQRMVRAVMVLLACAALAMAAGAPSDYHIGRSPSTVTLP